MIKIDWEYPVINTEKQIVEATFSHEEKELCRVVSDIKNETVAIINGSLQFIPNVDEEKMLNGIYQNSKMLLTAAIRK
ncbi:hypothetical protein QE429_000845 [Bacillus sp. SORGH_AS 510]|uniref:hypothetical protein n=1 Tax=Bacillus sp. SORGH_AS_0510 TaxID=3041771 RepID=UPI002783E1E2|nr:hypothetical protein [Bacillus sp. SORGH_AS_0510]MDQ1144018.1 hypothetical protein [Bacillus sp. SORGH_AS_0510]